MPAEDYKQVIQHIRGDRVRVAQPSAGSRVTKARNAAAAKPNGDDLLAQLEGL